MVSGHMLTEDESGRVAELRTLIADNQLDRATRRLLDLVADLGSNSALRDEAIALCAREARLRSERRLLGDTSESENLYRRIIADCLGLVNSIEDELLATRAIPFRAKEPPRIKRFQEAFTEYKLRRDAKNLSSGSIGDVVIRCQSLALQRVRFSLRVDEFGAKLGEVVALVGPNGSGKTTFLKLLAHEIAPSGGSVELTMLDGCDYYTIKRHIAYLPQDLKAWRGDLLTEFHLEAAAGGKRGIENEEAVAFILHRLGLEDHVHLRWHQLSAGYQTRFSLARALLREPQILILDEPLAHLDVAAQEMFLQDLVDIGSSPIRPIAIVLSSQHLHEAERIAHQVVVMKDGKVSFSGSRRDLGNLFDYSCFEVSCSMGSEDLRRILEHLNVRVEERLGGCLLFAPSCFSSRDILVCLLNGGVEIEVFRDISNSSKRLLT